MKKFSFLIASLLFTLCVQAQAPQKFSYQMVIRNASNQLLVGQTVGIKISILQGSANGSAVYAETHTPQTNANGLATLEIGGGSLLSGNFANINWANGPFFVKTETDLNGGNNYTITYTSQLLSVPYALYAASAGNNSPGPQGPAGQNGANGQNGTNGQNGLNCWDLDGDGVNDANEDVNNDGSWSVLDCRGSQGPAGNPATDDQNLSVSITGDTLYLQNGGFVIIPGISSANFPVGSHSCGATNVHNPAKTYGSMTDQEGNVYKTIVIGTQEWMAENLKTSLYRNGDVIATNLSDSDWQNTINTQLGAWSYYNNDIYYKYPSGKLYNWYAVSDPRHVCPIGWHEPTYTELTSLNNFLGGGDVAGGKVKATGFQFWVSPNTDATNESGFSAIPSGLRDGSGSFGGLGNNCWLLSSTGFDLNDAWSVDLDNNQGSMDPGTNDKRYGFSVRCIRDEAIPQGSINYLDCESTSNTGGLTQGITAVNVSSSVPYTGGNEGTYSAQILISTGVAGLIATLNAGSLISGAGSLTYTITGTPASSGTANFALSIGGQTCTLTITVNPSGQTGIAAHSCGATNVHNPAKTYGSMTDQQGNVYKTIVIGNQEWMAENLKSTIYRNGNAIANVIDSAQWTNLTSGAWAFYNNDSQFDCPYGKLYNWYAVTDPRHICPAGWHEPTDAEWTTLANYLGGEPVAGGKMKSTGLQYWFSPNQYATNESGFSGLPGGSLYGSGTFGANGADCSMWSSSAYDINTGWDRYLFYYGGIAFQNYNDKRDGFSVRCLKD